MKRAASWFRLLLLVTILAFAVLALANSWDSVRDSLATLSLGDLAAALGLLILAYGFQYVAWRHTLVALGAGQLRRRDGVAVFVAAQLAKYVPGSVWPAIVQADLGRRHGIGRRVMLSSYAFLLLLSFGTGGIVSLLVLTGPSAEWTPVIAVVACVAGGLLLWAVTDRRVLHKWMDKFFVRFTGGGLPTTFAGRPLFYGAVAVLVSWLSVGLHVWVLARPMGATAQDSMFVIGAVVLSWIIGLVVIPLPAGAGARELVLVLTLGQLIGSPQALALGVLSRFFQIAVELGLAIVVGVPALVKELGSRPSVAVPK